MPTDEQRALWAAIRAHPLDDTPRLVYADWLQENGDDARAEFIRLQIEQNAMFSPSTLCSDPNERRLAKRETQLIRCHRDKWLDPLYESLEPTELGYNWKYSRRCVKFSRGFPRDVSLSLRAAYLLIAPDPEIEPLADVKIGRSFFVEGQAAALVAKFARWPGADCIKEIGTDDATDEFVKATAGGFLTDLQNLDFHTGTVSDAGAVLLADWPQAASLKVLDLSENQITDAGAIALAESPYLGGLVKLYLDQNQFTAIGRSQLRQQFGSRLHIESEPV